jgi:antitoxin VapB
MTAIARLFNTGGSQAVRLPKEFRFPGKTVRLQRTRRGIVQIMAHDDVEERRARFLKLAGSCPDLPDVPRHATPDSPRLR